MLTFTLTINNVSFIVTLTVMPSTFMQSIYIINFDLISFHITLSMNKNHVKFHPKNGYTTCKTRSTSHRQNAFLKLSTHHTKKRRIDIFNFNS